MDTFSCRGFRHHLQVMGWRSLALSLTLLPSLVIGVLSLSMASVRAADLNDQLAIRLNNGTYGLTRDQADSLLRRGRAFAAQGLLPEAIGAWQQALKLYQNVGDREAEGVTYGYLATAYARTGQQLAYEDALRRQLAVSRDRQDFWTQIYAANNLGRNLEARGGNAGAEELFTNAVAISDSIKSLNGQALSYSNLGLLAFNSGNLDRATQEFEQALLASRKASDVKSQATILNNLGDIYRLTGRYPESMKYYALAFRLADLIQDRPNQFRAIDGMVTAYSFAGDYTQSMDMLRQRLKIAQTQENLLQQLTSLKALAQVYQRMGDTAKARLTYQRAITVARQLNDIDQENLLVQRLVDLTHGNN